MFDSVSRPAMSIASMAGPPNSSALYVAPSGRQLIASSYVPELDLYVIAELPEAQVLGGVRRTIALTSAVAGLVEFFGREAGA